jgi:SAM-dependent methyltransferase
VVRVADWAPANGEPRSALIVDESGSASPLGRWARACGFAPVHLGLTVLGGGYDVLDVDPATIDVVARVHPGGCDDSDVDEVLSQAAWALRPGGLFVVTLPLGRPRVEGALGPAEVRAVVARAHEQGFVLVGDLDGEVGHRMRAAGTAAAGTPERIPGSAYGLVRLTLRRR